MYAKMLQTHPMVIAVREGYIQLARPMIKANPRFLDEVDTLGNSLPMLAAYREVNL